MYVVLLVVVVVNTKKKHFHSSFSSLNQRGLLSLPSFPTPPSDPLGMHLSQ